MNLGPRDPRGSQPETPHDRARELAAERLSLPLPTAEQVWLDGHLRICRSCAGIAAAYAADREALRRLVAPEPPRDLWARTSTGLDAAEREMAHRTVAGPPAQGSRRLRQGSAPRTIRSIRAERHASAIRSAGFRASMRRSSWQAEKSDRPRTAGWLIPFGGLAALALVIVVGGSALLAQGLSPSAPLVPTGTVAVLANPSLQVATPIPVGAADVSWLSPGENGSYTWNSAQVDQVCPATASPDCAPIDGSQSSPLASIGSRPRAVLRSPSKSQLVVVGSGNRNGAQAVYVISVPQSTVTVTPAPEATAGSSATGVNATPKPSPSIPGTELMSASPSASTAARPSPTIAESPGPTASPRPVGTPAPSHSPSSIPSPTTSSATTPEPSPSPTSSSAAATPAPSSSPTSTAAPGSSSAPVGVPGSSVPAPPAESANPGSSPAPESPAPSPSLAPTVSASPIAPGTPEPTAAATLAIISNVIVVGETAAYSPDGTMLAFSARPADGSHGPDIYLWHTGDAFAQPVTFDHASTFSGWWGSTLIGSRAVPVDTDTDVTPDSSAGDAPTPSAAPSVAPTASLGGQGDQGDQPGAGTSPSGSALGFAVSATATGSSAGRFVAPIDGTPRSTIARQFSDFFAMAGLLSSGAAGAASVPATRPAVAPSASGAAGSSTAGGAAPSATDAPSDEPSAPPTDLPSGAANASPAAGASASDAASQAIPESFLIDTATGAETQITALPAWRPVVDPTGRFAVYWNGTLRYDAATVSWVPDRGQLFVASWPALTGSNPTAQLVPMPLLAGDPDGTPSGDWDIRWDASGQHLAIWVADSADPNIGRLTLLTIDGATGATTPNGLLLHDAPAQPGFSLGSDRLAWATPPGQDGEGSRLQILAWTGENAGKIDSEPASGPDAVIVVR